MLLLHCVRVGVAMLSLSPPPTVSFSRGASITSCQEMTPGHIRAQPQDPRHSYVTVRTSASAYRPGQLVTVTVRSSRDFMGFLLQARSVGNSGEPSVGNRSTGGDPALLGGTWTLTPPGAHTLRCLSEADAVTHADKQLKRNLSFVWKAPDTPIGDVRFYITVVQSYFVYWASIESAVLRDGTRRMRNQVREPFLISVPPVVKNSNDYMKATNEPTTHSPGRQRTRSHVDTSTKSQVTHVALEEKSASSLTTLGKETLRSPSGVMVEPMTPHHTEEPTDPPTLPEPKDLGQEREGWVEVNWISPTTPQTSSTANLQSTLFQTSPGPGTLSEISPNPIHSSRLHTPLFQSHGATDDSLPLPSKGTPPGLKTSPSHVLILFSSSAPPQPPYDPQVFQGTSMTQMNSIVHDAQRDQFHTKTPPEPGAKPFPLTDTQTVTPRLFPNQTLHESSDDPRFQSPETPGLTGFSTFSDGSSATNSSSSSSFTSTSSSDHTSSPTVSQRHTTATPLMLPTPSPIGVPVQPSSPSTTEHPSSLSSPASSPFTHFHFITRSVSSSLHVSSTSMPSHTKHSSASIVPPRALRSTSPGPSPVRHRSLNAAFATSLVPLAPMKPTVAQQLITHPISTSDPKPTPSRTVIHPNPKPHPNLKLNVGHEARPNMPNAKLKPAPETPDKERKYPDIIPRHSDWELGMLLGCSAGLGMVLVVAIRYVYRQACGRQTEVTLNDQEREYTRGERGLIHVQECGDLVRVRKIRENSFVLLAEYDILAPPVD